MLFMSSLFFLCSGSNTPPSSSNTEAAVLLASRSNSGISNDEELAKESTSRLSPLYYEDANALSTIVQTAKAGDASAQCALLYALNFIMCENDPTLEKLAQNLRSAIEEKKFEAFEIAMENKDPKAEWNVALDNLIEGRANTRAFDTFYQKVETEYLPQAPITARKLMERIDRHRGNTIKANQSRQQIDAIYKTLRTIVTE